MSDFPTLFRPQQSKSHYVLILHPVDLPAWIRVLHTSVLLVALRCESTEVHPLRNRVRCAAVMP
eukprot:COSAG02_NODE_3834_length_6173_cov_6.023708_1_plen_64_part_00